MSEADRYRKANVPASHPYNGLRRFLKPGMEVLDVGCGSGDAASALSDVGAVFDGIEASAERAAVAAPLYRKVLVSGYSDAPVEQDYDLVLFLDVLEHLPDPALAMRWAASHTRERGAVLTLIPNAAHWTARMKLLRGDWSYSETGLFDRDHIRFFDLSTMTQLGSQSPLEPVSRQFFPGDFPRGWRLQEFSLRRWPQLFALHVLTEWRHSES
jgi:SAM-dependent methyltransferase